MRVCRPAASRRRSSSGTSCAGARAHRAAVPSRSRRAEVPRACRCVGHGVPVRSMRGGVCPVLVDPSQLDITRIIGGRGDAALPQPPISPRTCDDVFATLVPRAVAQRWTAGDRVRLVVLTELCIEQTAPPPARGADLARCRRRGRHACTVLDVPGGSCKANAGPFRSFAGTLRDRARALVAMKVTVTSTARDTLTDLFAREGITFGALMEAYAEAVRVKAASLPSSAGGRCSTGPAHHRRTAAARQRRLNVGRGRATPGQRRRRRLRRWRRSQCRAARPSSL